MAASGRVVLDDRLLIEELLAGLPIRRPRVELFTTTYWYYRACRAAVAGGGGHLSGPFEQLGADEQARAILSLLELRKDIGLPDPRATVPAMARIASRHPRLNVLNLEAAALAKLLLASVWLSEQSAGGVLPAVFETEGVPWSTITVH
ncbi:hypothetical protein BH18ACT4_BH18ACT4_00690 [soil metagenome]